MQVLSITKGEFLAHKPQVAPMAAMLAEELAWYEREDKRTIGVVIKDRHDHDFSFVLMAPQAGKMRAADVATSFKTEDEATKELLRRMEKFQ